MVQAPQGDSLIVAAQLLTNGVFCALKDASDNIRASSLSLLASLCSNLGSALSPFIIEIASALQSIFITEKTAEVRRGTISFVPWF